MVMEVAALGLADPGASTTTTRVMPDLDGNQAEESSTSSVALVVHEAGITKNESSNGSAEEKKTIQDLGQAVTTHTTSNSCVEHQPQRTSRAGRQRRVSGDVDLKSKIIEFMRDRPFLWNYKHPQYRDNRRRENEFHKFSQSLNHPASDIKRIWHVLRTNFFRAHRLMQERDNGGGDHPSGASESGEKLWKYYRAMEFILDRGTRDSIVVSSSNNNNDSMQEEPSSQTLGIESARQTRSSKMLKDANGLRRDVPGSTPTSVTREDTALATNISSQHSETTMAIPLPASSFSPRSRNLKSHHRTNLGLNNVGSLSGTPTLISSESPTRATRQRASNSSGVNDLYSTSTYDSDEDHLYVRSLTTSLKKFDATTKEVIKLKFQEIIVEFMLKQQGSQAAGSGASQAKLEEPNQ